MIKISTRYIGWSVCKMILLVLFIVAVLQYVMGFVGDLGHIGHGSYTIFRSMYCLALALPMHMYGLFSVIAFLGTVLSLGLLVQRNELVVFRASGLSLYRLLGIVLRTVFILLVLVTFVGECVAPHLNKIAVTLKQESLYKPSKLVHHYWWKNDNKFYFTEHAKDNTHIAGLVTLNLPRKGQEAAITYAETAEKNGNNWLARNEMATQLKKGESTIALLHNKMIPALIHINSSQPARHAVDQESVFNLKHVIKERQEEGRSIGRFLVAYWSRELQPLGTLVLVLLGVPLVFTQMKRSTGGSRLLMGIGIGFVFYLLNQLLAPVGVLMRWPPALVVLLPIAAFLLLGLYLMKRVSSG